MNIIQLGGNRYEIRNRDGNQEIKLHGKWISAEDFADHLFDEQDMAAIEDILSLEMNLNQVN